MADLFAVVGKRSSRVPPSTPGTLSFSISASHDIVTYYEARIRVAGASETVVATVYLGKPAPYVDGKIYVDISDELNALSAGSYEVSVAEIAPGETTMDSGESEGFEVPL